MPAAAWQGQEDIRLPRNTEQAARDRAEESAIKMSAGNRVAPAGHESAAGNAQKGFRAVQTKAGAVAAFTGAAVKHESSRSSQSLRKSLRNRPARAVAKGSRVSGVHRFSGSYLYFVLLERSWWFCLGLTLSFYLISIALCALLAATAFIDNTQEQAELDEFGWTAPRWEQCLRFAAAHIITMGSGSVAPLGSWGHVLAWLQQILGLLINVFSFAVILAKFTAPQSDLVWSDGGVLRSRDGVPHLLLRVGNLRCHTLYSPSIRLTLLRRHVTAEGEAFYMRQELEIDQPATISGVHTVAHRIDADSPLAPFLESGLLRQAMGAEVEEEASEVLSTRRRLSLHAVIQAFDNVYGGELCATSTYGRGSIRMDARFEDMIRMANGVQTIDWDAFNTTVPCDGDDEEAEDGAGDGAASGTAAAAAREAALRAFKMEGDPEPKEPPKPGRPYIACGSSRASYGDKGGELDRGAPRSPLVPYCPYCLRLMLLLVEGGAEFETIKIDTTERQPWFVAAFPPTGGTPAILGTPGGIEGKGWLGETDEIRARFVAAHAGVARANELRSPISEKAVHDLGEVLLLGSVAPRIVGTREESGVGLASFCLSHAIRDEKAAAGLLERIRTGEGAAYTAAVQEATHACHASLHATLNELSTLLTAAEARGGFLGGDAPDPADCVLMTALWGVKALFESGLADLPHALGGFKAMGHPALEDYVQRWCKRRSWAVVFGVPDAFNASLVRAYGTLMVKAADVCPPEKIRSAMVRARHMCPTYRAMLRAQGRSGLLGGRAVASVNLRKGASASADDSDDMDAEEGDGVICT